MTTPIPPWYKGDKHDKHPYCPFVCIDCDEYSICVGPEEEFQPNPPRPH